MAQADFITSFYPYAKRVAAATGIDPRLVLAQAALETGWGKSAPGQNYFGIKAPSGDGLMTTEFVDGRPVQMRQPFRTYEDPAQSFADYGRLMMSPRYERVRQSPTLETQAEALQAAGYATDPEYAQKLVSVAAGIPQTEAERIGGATMTALGRTRPRTMEAREMADGLLGTQMMPAQPAQPQERRGLGAALSNPDFFDNLALAFNTLRMTPDPNLAQAIGQRQQMRREAATKNRTIEFLRQRGREDLAAAVESGAIDARTAAAQLFAQPETVRGVAVGNRLVNPVTGDIIYEPSGAGAVDQEKVIAARKEFTALPQVKDFANQTAAYGRIIASVEDPSPAGDLALIFNFMKVLDPGSVVREGEFATAANAGGVDERVRGMYNRVMSGERLTPEQRADFADRATRLYGNAQGQYKTIAEQYGKFATSAGLPPEQVIPDFGYGGGLYQTPLKFKRPPTPEGISDEDWAAAWDAMTDEQRRQFIDGGR